MEPEDLSIAKPEEEYVFPDEFALAIEEFVERYGMKKIQEDGAWESFKAEDPKIGAEIFKSLPGAVLSQIVRDYYEGKISLKEVQLILEQKIKLPAKEIKNLAKDMEETILVLVKPRKKEVSLEKTLQKKTPISEKPIQKEEPISPVRKSKEPDVYREPVEE